MRNLLSTFVAAAMLTVSPIPTTAAYADSHPCEVSDSLECTRSLVESGQAEAQFNLGHAYRTGEGITKDYREAAHLFRLAAEQEYAPAQNSLGFAYHIGEGVAKDYREAVRWYRLAAEQGLAKAQYNLGGSYWNGEGVIEDARKSYIWFAIAKANGYEAAAEYLRDLPWHQHLTATEFKSAKREAARRLAAIDARNSETEDESESGLSGVLSADKLPQNKSLAEKVFENSWRSIVVIKSGEDQGSGVVIRPNIVATNCHVVENGGNIVVYKHDNRRASTDTLFAATIRRRNASKDFCLLNVDGLWGIPVAVRKYETLNIGENVYALGSPQGLDLSLFTGVISQLREDEDDRHIQTNAAISPGSSGGGLFDAEGNLIGILTSKIADEDVEGIGFAIPADLALEL